MPTQHQISSPSLTFFSSPHRKENSLSVTLSLSSNLLVLPADSSFYLETHSKTPTTKVLLESTFAHLVPSLPPTNSNFSKGSFS